jgi:hypothetical protein
MVVKKSTSSSKEVVIERDGKTVTGHYTVESGVVRVTYYGGNAVGGASKATQVGNSSAERIARMLLGELVGEHG